MILDILNQLGPWGWWILGIILLGLELVIPGSFFVWIGVAAIVTGVMSLFTDFTWQTQAIVFAVLSVVIVIAGRSYFARRGVRIDQPLLNQRAVRLVGRRIVLADPIVGGEGKVRIDDTVWRVAGPDVPSGTEVVVRGADGGVLLVTTPETA
ncbi:MAG TPA: NfeD family protein [Bauldia sp.]|nr:NfeD family protein [Bauldia sp.]